jgi:hypothetical protein
MAKVNCAELNAGVCQAVGKKEETTPDQTFKKIDDNTNLSQPNVVTALPSMDLKKEINPPVVINQLKPTPQEMFNQVTELITLVKKDLKLHKRIYKKLNGKK